MEHGGRFLRAEDRATGTVPPGDGEVPDAFDRIGVRCRLGRRAAAGLNQERGGGGHGKQSDPPQQPGWGHDAPRATAWPTAPSIKACEGTPAAPEARPP